MMAGRRFPWPRQGLLAPALAALVCLTLAWSLDDARLVLGREELTDLLVWTALAGALVGWLGPLVGWGRWTTFGVGAVFAALIGPLIVGSVLLPDGGSPAELFRATAASTVDAWSDLIVQDRLSTTQYGHHLLVLGLLVWGSSMFATYAAFGHRRPLHGIALIGALLVANMALTVRDQLPYLVIFSLAALFLLIRLHGFEERTDWLRHRIGDPSTMAGLHLRSGSVFIGIAVLGSLLLTNVAASDPLAGIWTDASVRFVEWSRAIDRFLPKGGQSVAFAPSFGSAASISGAWVTNNDLALTVEIPPTELDVPYWRAVTYDRLELDGYRRGQDGATVDRAADAPLLDDTADAVDLTGRRQVSFRITPATSGDTLFAPQTPISVSIPTRVTLVGGDGYFAAVDRSGSSGPYTVTSLVPVEGDQTAAGLTQNRLRVAGLDYPAAILARYASQPQAGIIGPQARRIFDAIVAEAGDNPYDFAAATEAYLRDGANFTYDANVLDDGIDCAGLSKVECFAVSRRGYCQYYAAMMTGFMREAGIPARIAEGFLPGQRVPSRGISEVRNSDAHAWVEVYFPAYGWVDFDPTGGGVARLGALPLGQVEASASPAPSDSGTSSRPPDLGRDRRGEPLGGGAIGGTPVSPTGPLIAIAILLAVVVAGGSVLAWRRGPRGPVSADGAYGSVARLAARLGFAPRPSQTVYEYANALAERLPGSRLELETVARAKVEVAYGGRVLSDDRLVGVRHAQRRLRISLLGLAVRRPRRRERP